jgi:hypothetical protein
LKCYQPSRRGSTVKLSAMDSRASSRFVPRGSSEEVSAIPFLPRVPPPKTGMSVLLTVIGLPCPPISHSPFRLSPS